MHIGKENSLYHPGDFCGNLSAETWRKLEKDNERIHQFCKKRMPGKWNLGVAF